MSLRDSWWPTVSTSKQVGWRVMVPASSSTKTNTSSPCASHPHDLNMRPSFSRFVAMFSGLLTAPPDWPAMKYRWFG